jgi:hypothetical protein
MLIPSRHLVSLVAISSFSLSAVAEPKPVPKVQAVPQAHDQVSFQSDGVELARYHFGRDGQRPYVFPLNGPSGRSVTRIGHPHDPQSHSHHNSVWISHQNVQGINFWEDNRAGGIVHQRMLRMDDGNELAFVEVENAWLNKDAAPVLHELRRTGVRVMEKGEWMLELDIQLEARGADVELGQTGFGLLGVRMAKTIGVKDGGGTIRNSEGGVDEEGCFRKAARWVDYSGPIAPGVTEGVTLMDHPANLNHPVPFHVRDDGWMGAALTFPAAHTIRRGEPLRLRYALYIHAGIPAPEQLEARWKAFAGSEFAPFPIKK